VRPRITRISPIRKPEDPDPCDPRNPWLSTPVRAATDHTDFTDQKT
jgi:hypothetical protein